MLQEFEDGTKTRSTSSSKGIHHFSKPPHWLLRSPSQWFLHSRDLEDDRTTASAAVSNLRKQSICIKCVASVTGYVCIQSWRNMYTVYFKKRCVCVCTVYIYMGLSAHQNITKIHALERIFKIIYRYLHIHISYIDIQILHENTNGFWPPLQTSFWNVAVQNMECWLLTTAPTPFQLHHVMRERNPPSFGVSFTYIWAVVNTPISQIWGRWGGSSYWFLIGNPGHQKKWDWKNHGISHRPQMSYVSLFHSKAWDQKKSVAKISSEL